MFDRARSVALLFALFAIGCRSEPHDAILPALGDDFEPVRGAFDADSEHVRILAILSPT